MCLTAILQARSIHISYDMQCHDLFELENHCAVAKYFMFLIFFRLSWMFEFVSNLERVADCIFIVEDIVCLHVGVSIRITSFRAAYTQHIYFL